MATTSLRFVLEGKKYVESVKNTSVCLKYPARRVVVRHLSKLYELEKDDVFGLLDSKVIKIEEITDSEGCDVDIDVDVKDMEKSQYEFLTLKLTKKSLEYILSHLSSGDPGGDCQSGGGGTTEIIEASESTSISKSPVLEGTETSVQEVRTPAPAQVNESREVKQEFGGCMKFESSKILAATENFSLSRKLGKGGQGCVYRGTLSGTEYAIKKFNEGSFKSMLSEMENLFSARHPNIVTMVGICMEQNCIVSEFVDGGSLKDRMGDKESPLTWNDKKNIIEMMVQALRFLHDMKLVHLDLKPDNVFLKSNLEVKIGDMGSSRRFNGTTEYQNGHKDTGRVFTMGYVDPMYLEHGKAHHTNDIFSLGLMILQLCTNIAKVNDLHKILGSEKSSTEHMFGRLQSHLAQFDDTLPKEICWQIIIVGIECVKRDPEKRPSLEHIHKCVGDLSDDKISPVNLLELMNSITESKSAPSKLTEEPDRVDNGYAAEGNYATSKESVPPVLQSQSTTGSQGLIPTSQSLPTDSSSKLASGSSHEFLPKGSDGTTPRAASSNFSPDSGHSGESSSFQSFSNGPDISPHRSLSVPNAGNVEEYVPLEGMTPEKRKRFIRNLRKLWRPWTELGKKYLYGWDPCQQDYSRCYTVLMMALDKKEPKALIYIEELIELLFEFLQSSPNESYLEVMEMDSKQHAFTALRLGHLYATGAVGVGRVDEKKAFQLYLNAATGGNIQAQWNLGLYYHDGRGVEKSKQLAKMCFEKAADNGDKDAVRVLKRLRARYVAPSQPFKWRIDNFSSKFNAGSVLQSDTFSAHGSTWRMRFFPKGNDNNSSHISVYLVSVSLKGFRVIVQYSFLLMNFSDPLKSRPIEWYGEFTKQNQLLGVQRHTPIHDVMDPNNGFIENDAIEILATIEVSA